jgi:hypothetical protein
MAEDYYTILGLHRGASQAEIQRAYRQLARKYHPDVNPDDPYAEKKFIQLENAYEMLCEPERCKPKGAYHTVLSAFLTVRCCQRSSRAVGDGAMGDSEFIPSLLAMATILWLAVVCACGLMMVAAGPPGDSAVVAPTDADHQSAAAEADAETLIGGILCLATFLYLAFVVTVIAKWSPI